MTRNEHHLLICTVGGTSEPIVAAIRHWSPARVLLVHSGDTKSSADSVTKEPELLQPGAWDMMELHDAQDFSECVRQMRAIDEQVGAWRRKGDDYNVAVDFTGGTKCMSAAIALVSRRWPCSFSYVGGTERNKDGTGIVVSGKEWTLVTQNPWNALGYQAIEDACLLFDQRAFVPAMNRLDNARKAADDDAVKRLLSTCHQLCEGYGLWDRFQHNDAAQRIANVLKNASGLHAMLGAGRSDDVVRQIKQHHEMLQGLAQRRFSRAMVADLMSNAERRKREGRYDDGVARLYRAIESIAQVALDERHKITSTDDVPADRIPEALRERWALRVKDGKVALGLQDVFLLLDTLDDPAGKAFKKLGLHESQRSPLTARNQSILAHGFQPVGEAVFDRLWKAAMSLSELRAEDLPVFPQLATDAG